jgi:endonuclease-3
VSNRIGIAKGDDAVAVEQQLCGALPKEKWTVSSDTLILHGRRICKPKPLCDKCSVREDCLYYLKVVSKARAPQGAARRGAPDRGSRAKR